MSGAIHFLSGSLPGYGPPDSRCLPCSGVSPKALGLPFNSSHCDFKHVSDTKFPSLRKPFGRAAFLCNANSSNYRRNSDFSRQRKQGYSRNGNRNNEDKDGYEDLEDTETFSSKNGPLLSISGNQKFQATSSPGLREKEIVELFRKVQAQLRERAALKEEKKVEDSQGKGKENGTVDSLLKLLRKHSVQQGKKNDIASDKGFILDEPEQVGPSTQETRSSNVLYSDNVVKKHETLSSPGSHLSRPKSTFRRRSPVPENKFQPVYYDGSVNSVSQENLNPKRMDIGLKPEDERTDDLKIEHDSESYVDPLFSEENAFDEISEFENSEIYESFREHDMTAEEESVSEARNLSGMKLADLKALAKSRGLKGFSKLKKNELVELLSESST